MAVEWFLTPSQTPMQTPMQTPLMGSSSTATTLALNGTDENGEVMTDLDLGKKAVVTTGGADGATTTNPSPSRKSSTSSTTALIDPTQPQSHTKKILSKINSKLDNQYKLVLYHHPSHGLIKIGQLQMELRDFFLKSLANFLLSLFKTQVQDYIQRTINNIILEQSARLLETINEKVHKYLPKIAKILKRAEDKAPAVEDIVINAAKNIATDVKSDRAILGHEKGSQTPQTAPKLDIPIERLKLDDDNKKKKEGGDNTAVVEQKDGE